jgi:flagellar biosynthesis/type III secretory pathway protein FliH
MLDVKEEEMNDVWGDGYAEGVKQGYKEGLQHGLRKGFKHTVKAISNIAFPVICSRCGTKGSFQISSEELLQELKQYSRSA